MTLQEAQKLAKIIETADHRCEFCVQDLVTKLQIAFPKFDWQLVNGEIIVSDPRFWKPK